MKPGDSSKKREAHRAELLHGIFSRIANMGLTYIRAYRQARKLGGAKYLSSYSTFERLFLAWKKSPRSETLLRKWKPGNQVSSAKFVPAIVKFSLAARITLHDAHAKLGLPVSNSTLFRQCKIRREISRIAAIRRAQERLAMEEKSILKKVTGGKRA